MSRHRWLALGALPLWLLGCGDPPLVVQGTVVAVDTAAQTVTLKDEKAPDTPVILGVATAEVGAATDVGDVVRVAYRVRDGKPTASRVMNITKQAELREKGGH
jgi:hypothetical protein